MSADWREATAPVSRSSEVSSVGVKRTAPAIVVPPERRVQR
jgi:hypothetical protein